MQWKPRLIDPDELRSVADVLATVFTTGPLIPDDEYAALAHAAEPGRTFVVDDAGTTVGTGAAYTFDVAVPGATLPMAGVTWVGVLPTHRRRGILRAVMDAVLDQAIERGEPLAGLTASEGGIYRRFGFGVAARFQTIVVDTTRAAHRVVASDPSGRVRLITEQEAETALPAVWDRHWPRVPGEVGRSAGWWPSEAADPEGDRDGATRRFLAVHESTAGEPDGFAAYRFVHGGAPDGEYHELRVDDLAAADDRIESALLRYLSEIDLTRQLRWDAPLDLPWLWQLADPRTARVVRRRDHLWLRLLDVGACLAGRRYTVETGVVLDVIDPARPELGGRFLLETGLDGADCTRTTAEPDVTLRMPDLGSLYLGGVTWRTLQRAGLVQEEAPGAVDRLDALFRPTRAPYCATEF